MKTNNCLKILIIGLSIFALHKTVLAQTYLAQKLAGKILLQVESKGEAWYVNPVDQKRYFLGRPTDALTLMRQLALGVSNANLNKIPAGLLDYSGTDDDDDGLNNNLEAALGTDPARADSDNDGYNDKTEMANNYNPLGQGKIIIDKNLIEQLKGKILLQVESAGAAWYLNPSDNKKYYLGRPLDAWQIMRSLALGITDENLEQIIIGQLPPTEPLDEPNEPNQPNQPNKPINQGSVLDQAAASIRNNNSATAQSFFTESMNQAIKYTIKNLNSEGRLLLANILSSAKLTSSNEAEKIYSTKVYFSLNDTEVPLTFRVEKQADGSWLIANL